MKNSRVILGATAFILAIAGAFATKASNRGARITAATRHTKGVNSFSCVNKQDSFCTQNNIGTNKCVTASTSRTLYTAIQCRKALQTVPGNS